MAKAKPKPAELTVAQLSAVDLLAGGKNDAETADALHLHRVTVTRWRNYSPAFRAALAERRRAVWGSAADKLRALLPKALDTLAAELENGDDKATVALALLKLAGPLPLTADEPTDPDEVVRGIVAAERDAHRQREHDEGFGTLDELPALDAHTSAVRRRLAAQAAEEPPSRESR